MATISVKQSGGDYSTLNAACAAASDGDTIEISGTWSVDDTASVTIPSNVSLTINAVGDSKCAPYAVASPIHYRLRISSGHAVTANASVEFNGIEIKNSSTGASDEVIRLNANDITVTVKNSLLYFNTRNDQQDLVYINDRNGCTVNLENVIGWNAYRSVVGHYSTSNYTSTVNINSCSFFNISNNGTAGTNARAGLAGASGYNTSNYATMTVSVFNTIYHQNGAPTGQQVFHKGAPEEDIRGEIIATCDRLITNATSVDHCAETDSLLSHNFTDDDTKSSDGDWVIFEDVTTAPYDLRLVSNAYNEALDWHSDSSGAGLTIPSADIAGTSRPQNTNYDCGAFEYVVSFQFLPIFKKQIHNLTRL